VSPKSHYDVLEVASTAPGDEIKRAFRAQIARYHPDKVQHLGKEFQEMAAGRAAELTEAYRVLSNEVQRADYDRLLAVGGGQETAASPPPAPQPHSGSPAPPPPATPQADEPRPSAAYTKERASRDQFVRKATMDRIRQALVLIGSDYNETQVRGFDLALTPKPKLFGGGKRPRVLGRFVEPVNGAAVAEAWAMAIRGIPELKDDLCLLLLGSSVAPPRELAEAIAEQRRKSRNAKIIVIPIDVRTWDAHMPVDAPGVCRDLLARLKAGN
jgi:curved DNA-binding protein CbpA